MENAPNLAQLNVVKAFVEKWKSCTSAKNVLLLTSRARFYPKDEQGKSLKTSLDSMFAAANKFRAENRWIDFPEFFGVFSAVDFEGAQVIGFSREIDKELEFDLIIGDLPFGMNRVDFASHGVKLKIPQNWVEIFQSLHSLSKNGTALYLLEPRGFSSDLGVKFEKELNELGFYINGFFNTPEKMLQPQTSITPVIVLITRKNPSDLFVAELLNEKQSEQVVDTYFSSKNGGELETGMHIDLGSFYGFHKLRFEKQIESLETHYKNYSKYTLGKLALEINSVNSGGTFTEKDNSVYVPRIGNSPVVSRLSEAKLKHHNYFQIVLRDFVLNEYVSAFFKSTLGLLILDSLSSQTFIPHLNKRDVSQILVALPKPEEQKNIIETHKTLSRLKDAIDEFDSELALNPGNSVSIQKQLTTMLDVIGQLTDADKVYGLIRQGESLHIEFKETLTFDVNKQVKNKDLETSALKEVVAFLNTEGGILLIGVSDQKVVKGIDYEIDKFYKDIDGYLLQWTNLVVGRIGAQYVEFIKPESILVTGKTLLRVTCKKSSSPCFLDSKDFYVRTNPAALKLEGSKLAEYIQNHFQK